MGKKGSWFSAIKRVFVPNSKAKLVNESETKSTKEKKKKGLGRRETNSFLPLFREPSSIEKILGDAEKEHQLIFRPPTPQEQPKTPPFVPPRVPSPRVPSQRIASPRAASPRVASPRVTSPRNTSPRATSPRAASPRAPPRAPSPRIVHHRYRPEPTLRIHHALATRIQAAYRGYMARRSFRALKGLVRLQGVVRGQNVKRQTANAMKHMQLLVRVQSQIQSRRIQMLENQARRQAQYRNDKEVESTFSKWNFSQASEAGNGDWDDSVLTKEEIEARMQKKVEAVIKRERSMAYAYSHQLWKSTPKSTQTTPTDIRSEGFPWWWNWVERQLPSANPPESQATKSFQLTPPRPPSEMRHSPRPQSSNYMQQHFGFDCMDTPTPKSSRSTILPTAKRSRTPPSYRVPPASISSLSNYTRPRASGVESSFDLPLKDDDSLMSCPPFSVPNYMTPTVSAKAKVRASSNPKERFPGTPSSESKRRLSFPLTQGIGSFKWNKRSFFSSKDSSSQKIIDKQETNQSIGNLSVDSTVSLPATVGRKPFNRFV
ncbi:IQ domain-containing protein/DUF4005 domain-containing protein [Cephalotus follicularis]|uniref:IQ domain-containing protein/DUF4005 domain-containing protein n=1 Tax=Cephalotus follicularis TaxID=3775 RepID=A0A1Q3C885_CEPFO|nr:IQ domain-containing protein/DUF4005 domain-containing protein [Cephalotus follicularis]